MAHMKASGHMRQFLDLAEYRTRIRLAKRALKPWLPHFDSIAFRGMSGALIGPPVALALKKQMILVRKPNDDSHSLYRVEGYGSSRAYIILDDFTASGDTQMIIREDVAKFAPKAVCLGVLSVRDIDDNAQILKEERLYGGYRLVYRYSPTEYQRGGPPDG